MRCNPKDLYDGEYFTVTCKHTPGAFEVWFASEGNDDHGRIMEYVFQTHDEAEKWILENVNAVKLDNGCTISSDWM